MSTILSLLTDQSLSNKHVLEKLISHHCSIKRISIHTHHEKAVSEKEKEAILHDYRSFTQDHKPLEYILGYVTFFDTDFFVSPDTLIPRPETEYMIESIDEYLIENGQKHILVDIGT